MIKTCLKIYYCNLNAVYHHRGMTNKASEMTRKSTERLPNETIVLFKTQGIKILDSFSIKSKYTSYRIYSIAFLN